MRGAPKRDKNGRHLTVIQRLVGKYGIEEGSKIYRHFGVKQKKASRKGTKVRGTKSGPRRYSEGKVGGKGRSQIYQKGDRTGSWTKSGGITPRHANTGKAWSQERGDGTPVGGPLPKTKMTEKAYGKGKGGKMVNPKGVVGYPFVPAQAREQKKKGKK
ncbi:MAG: hypothetical protein GY751_10315 [Bacteroidetes bacterium]|nr:hypothetical protein [Bacteroidota bacterium]